MIKVSKKFQILPVLIAFSGCQKQHCVTSRNLNKKFREVLIIDMVTNSLIRDIISCSKVHFTAHETCLVNIMPKFASRPCRAWKGLICVRELGQRSMAV